MKHHSQLTYEQRCQISVLLQEELSQSAIARRLGVSQSTISRELKRNTGMRGYRHKQAQSLRDERRHNAITRPKMIPTLINKIDARLREYWSPEQISGWLDVNEDIQISHESIYLHVWGDRRKGGDLYTCLRHKLKGYRSRASDKGSRGKIKDRVGIEDRPEIVDQRGRIGDWEIDLMIGKEHSGAMLTLVERSTRFTLSARINDKTAESAAQATIALLAPYQALVLTITADNGKEFANHEKVSKALDCDYYFADPYCSWQRGTNENTNGLLRQYWPKQTDFKTVDEAEVDQVVTSLNNRPRKILGYQTPAAMMQAELKNN